MRVDLVYFLDVHQFVALQDICICGTNFTTRFRFYSLLDIAENSRDCHGFGIGDKLLYKKEK